MDFLRKGRKSALVAAMLWAVSVGTVYAEDSKSFELDPVVVTATRTGQRSLDVAADTVVVTSEDIQRKGAVTLADAIEGAPGVTIARANGRGGIAFPYINGTDMVVVMVDGVKLNAVQGASSGKGGVDLNQFGINPDTIDRIEIVRGGNSALYGANAIGGVIQIFTKKGSKEYTSNFGMAFGDDSQMQFRLGTSGSKDKWDWRFNGTFYETDGYRDNGFSRDKDLSMRVGRKTGGGDLFFKYDYSYHKTGIPGGLSSLTPNDYGVSDHHLINIGYTKNDQIFQYYYKDRTFKGVQSGIFRHEEKTHGFLYQDSGKLGKNNLLTWGADMFVAEVDSSNYPRDKKRWKRSFFLQDQMTFGKFVLTPAVLYDMNNDYDNKFLPKVGGLYKADSSTSFYANWGKVYRAPSFDELYWYQVDSWGYVTSGRDNLKPETGWSFETGIKKVLSDKHEISINYFKRQLENRIAWVYDWVVTTQAQNVDAYRAKGFSVTWTAKFNEHFRSNIGYTHVKTTTSQTSFNEPRNQFNMSLHYDNRDFSQSIMLESLSARDQYAPTYLAGHGTINTSTQYKMGKNQKVYLNVYNVLNHKYNHDRSQWGGYYPANGISYMAGWEVKF